MQECNKSSESSSFCRVEYQCFSKKLLNFDKILSVLFYASWEAETLFKIGYIFIKTVSQSCSALCEGYSNILLPGHALNLAKLLSHPHKPHTHTHSQLRREFNINKLQCHFCCSSCCCCFSAFVSHDSLHLFFRLQHFALPCRKTCLEN